MTKVLDTYKVNTPIEIPQDMFPQSSEFVGYLNNAIHDFDAMTNYRQIDNIALFQSFLGYLRSKVKAYLEAFETEDKNMLLTDFLPIYTYIVGHYGFKFRELDFIYAIGLYEEEYIRAFKDRRHELHKLALLVKDYGKRSVLGEVSENNSIGNIFLAKALYGYTENNTLTLTTSTNAQNKAFSEIMTELNASDLLE